MNRINMLFFIVLYVLSAGCSTGTGSDNQSQPDTIDAPLTDIAETEESITIDGRWLLASYTSEDGGLTMAAVDVPFSFFFSRNDQGEIAAFGGFDSCNAYGSEQINVQNDMIFVVEGISIDTGSCDNRLFGLNANQGEFFFSVISDSFTYQVVNSQLILESLSGRSLTFNVCEPVDPDGIGFGCFLGEIENLDQTSWALESIQLDNGSIWMVRDTGLPYEFGIRFTNDDLQSENSGTVSGNLDCNGFGVPYVLSDATLLLGVATVTDASCEQTSDVVGIVFRFFTGQRTLSLEKSTDTLRLLSGTNEALIYTRL